MNSDQTSPVIVTSTGKKRSRPGKNQRTKAQKKSRSTSVSSDVPGPSSTTGSSSTPKPAVVEAGTITSSIFHINAQFREKLSSITSSKGANMSLARAILKAELVGYNYVDQISTSLNTQEYVAMEESRLINVIISALLNPVSLPFDVKMFIERASKPAFRNYIPEQDELILNEPSTLVDIHGRILLWNLPEIFSKKRSMSIHHATTLLAEPLNDSLTTNTRKESKKDPKQKPCWRQDIDLFRTDRELKGVLDLSPGWFAQAQDNNTKPIVVSTGLRDDSSVDNFLVAMFRAEQLTNAINYLIAQELHDAGLETLRNLMTLPEPVPTYVHKWPTVASGIAIIVNRSTPPHRDQNGMEPCYDLLMTAGDYTDCYLELDELNIKVEYLPGGIVALCGKTFRHAVHDYNGGDRICIAHFFRRNVFFRMKTKMPEYVEKSFYTQFMGPEYVKNF